MTIEKLKDIIHDEDCELGVPHRLSTHERRKIIRAVLEAVIEQATVDDKGLCKCPFCEGRAKEDIREPVVWCSDCGCGTSPDCSTLEECKRDWNTRALITTIEEKLC